MLNDKLTNKSIRLHSIDFARGIAILMMLQGHFISLTYAGYDTLVHDIRSTGTSGNWIADVWIHMRSLTAPLFFTISGLVFMFILSGDLSTSFAKHKMVKRGLRRGITLILIGYILQLNVRNISYYFSGNINDRFFAFHVLQCIGTGLIILVLLYGLFKLIPRVKLIWIVGVVSAFIFIIHPFIEQADNYIPSGTHQAFQNLINGPHSIFPIVPWIGYLTAGAAMGVYIRTNLERIQRWQFLLRSTLYMITILIGFRIAFHLLDGFDFSVSFRSSGYIFDYLIIIVLLISLLLWLERKLNLQNSFIVVAGKNTLNIYVIHIMVLYGAFIGIGIKSWYNSNLNSIQAVVFAVIFIAAFVLMSYLQLLIPKWSKALKAKYFGIPHND